MSDALHIAEKNIRRFIAFRALSMRDFIIRYLR